MAFSNENGSDLVMPVQPINYGGNNNWGGFPFMNMFGSGFGSGFGGDGWIFLLFILAALGGWGGMGFGNNGGVNGAVYPWMLANNTDGNVNRGFDNSALAAAVSANGAAIGNGFSDISQSLCNGFAGVNSTVTNGFSNAEIAANGRQLSSLQQAYAAQTAIGNKLDTIAMNQQNCCCENRAGLADLKYTIATENCEDRYQAAQNTRDIIENANRNTQSIHDRLCQDKIDAKNEEIANLRSQLNMAAMQTSLTAQTARILADNAAQTSALEQYLNPVPIPAYFVQNPNCCGNGYYGCGCVG